MSITLPVEGALEQVTAAVDEMITVTEDALLAAMRLLIEDAGILAEPSGRRRYRRPDGAWRAFPRRAVAAVITGSNLDPRLVAASCGREPVLMRGSTVPVRFYTPSGSVAMAGKEQN